MVKGERESKLDLEPQLALIEQAHFDAELVEIACAGNVAPEIEKAARQQIARKVDEGLVQPAALLEQIRETDCLLAIAASCKSVDLESEVLRSVGDQAVLAKLAESASSAQVRQSLAERVEDPELLRALAKSFKLKDKKAYKIVKAKIDALRVEKNKQEALQNTIVSLCEEAEQHISRHIDRDYVQKVDRLKRRWGGVADKAGGKQKMRFHTAIEACENNVKKYRDELKEAEDFRIQVSELGDNRKKVLKDLWQLVNQFYALEAANEENLGQLREAFGRHKDAWATLKNYGKPNADEVKDYALMCDTIETLEKAYRENCTLIECCNRLSGREVEEPGRNAEAKYLRRLLYPIHALENYEAGKSVKHAIAALEVLDDNYAVRREDRQKQARLVASLIRKANRAVEQGRLKQAIGIGHSIDEKIETLDGLPPHVKRQLENLDASIKKLVDWQAYAVVPKKQSLIEEMERLIGSDMPPEALSTKIKKLQDRWKSLSQSGKDRSEDLWKKFSALADKAYEPCKTHYQQLAVKRKENLEKRRQLVAQIEDFYRRYDWENADWKHAEKIVRTARTELHGYAPVDRAANKEVLEKFEATIAVIQEKLDAEFEKNKAAKQQLISQAKKMSDIADIQQAIDTAKRLQVLWKNIGRCQRRDSDALWKDFRAHCDAVFERKEKEHSARKAQIDGRINEARLLVERLLTLAELSGEKLLSARSERDELQSTFTQVEGLPEKVHRAILRDFNAAAEKFDVKVEQSLRANEAQAWQIFFEACKKINDYQIAAGTDADISKSELESYVRSIAQWPEGGQSVIKEKLAQDVEIVNQEENVKTLKLLCIRAEILADKATPEEDKLLRMEYQVSLLQQGLGGQVQKNIGNKIAKEWAKTGPVAGDVYQQLYTRFYESWSALPAQWSMRKVR